MADLDCYCHYIDPGFPGDPVCVNCEEKVAAASAAAAAAVAAAATAQLALPDGHPERVFTEAQIRDVKCDYCDKKGTGRLLLRELRRRLGLN